ncbi:two-component regulator propeller domain-containing protein [Alistipes sp. ZOR0009]|uniref:ligand-binding sensor domain-containing protein n=1 Tax=Alistipes sp. ZOR0009 TaxID=1339253 RepID=UPI00064734AA|nr:two-component regulator propeller domain-containing protein [Alistipes sp. ZOR0009]
MRSFLILFFVILSIGGLGQKVPILTAKYEKDVFARFDNFTTKNGLPSNTIRRIFQDRDGFLWLATDNGLCRYDGSRFISFLPIKRDPFSLSNREVTSIAQTRDGYIWVGTKDGLNRLDPKNGHFKQYRVNKFPFIRHNYIRALLADSHGYLWIAFANGVTTQLNTSTLRYHNFHSDGNSWADYWQHFIFEKKDGNILFGGYSFPLREYSYKTKQASLVSDLRCMVIGRLGCLAAAYQDKSGNIWLANAASWGLFYNPSTPRYTELPKLGGLNAIAGDSRGNIWLGGYWPWLCCYNPAKNMVTQFEHSGSIPHSRLGQQTFSILCDRSGVVWIGTDAGLSRYSPYRYKFPLYCHIPDEATSPVSDNISSIFQDSENNVWFGTNDAGLFSLNLTNKQIHHYKHEPNNPHTISSKTITGIGEDKQGTLWLSLWDGRGSALNSIDKTTGKVRRHKTCDNYYWNNDIEVKNNKIIVGSWGYGLECYDKRKNDYSEIIRCSSTGFKRDINNIHSLTADGFGNLWFSSFTMFNAYSTNEKKFTSYFISSSHFNKVTRIMAQRFKAKKLNLTIESGPEHYFRDSKGVVWNVRESSLVMLNKKENLFKSYPISGKAKPSSISNSYEGNGFWLGGENGLIYFSFTSNSSVEYKPDIPLAGITTTAEISENRLVVGAASGLYIGDVKPDSRIIKFKKIGTTPFSTTCKLANGDLLLGGSMGLYVLEKRYSKLRKVADEGGGNVVHALHTLNGKDVYVGTDNGLMHYQQGRGITKWWKPNAYDRNQLIDEQVHSVTQTPDGTVWLATNRGYAKLNTDNRTFTHFYNEAKDALTSELNSKIFTDSRSDIWVGTTDNNGLNRIDGKTGRIDNYWNFLYDSTSICKGTINDIFESHDGSIWVATDNGLCRYLSKTNNFRRYTLQKGLGSSPIFAIQEDKRGNLWMSTLSGISCFNPQTLKCTNYTWKDGLQDGVFSRKCVAKLFDGRLVFGGSGGYNMFYPDTIRTNPIAPIPMVTSVVVNGKIRYIAAPRNLKFSYNERNVEISISCSDYNFPESNVLEYKLEGFDKLFKRVSAGHTAVYTNLPSGSYRFILKASNNDGKWSKQPLVMDIRVGYPIWFRWWAILIEFGVLLGLIFAAFKIRMQSITKQNQVLENMVIRDTEKLRLKSEEIAEQHALMLKQKEHIQSLYNQLSDNMEYASIIQQSLLFADLEEKLILDDRYLITLSKESLSGDFFWAEENSNEVRFLVGDSMHNGFSGAILGVIEISFVKQLVQSQKKISPEELLRKLHGQIETFAINSDRYRNLMGDIEIGFCVLNRAKGLLSYAGRRMNLYIAREIDEQIEIIECVGLSYTVQNSTLREEYVLVEQNVFKGDCLYLFTDGFTKFFRSKSIEGSSLFDVYEMIKILASHPFELQEAYLLERNYSDLEDDVTLLAIKV